MAASWSLRAVLASAATAVVAAQTELPVVDLGYQLQRASAYSVSPLNPPSKPAHHPGTTQFLVTFQLLTSAPGRRPILQLLQHPLRRSTHWRLTLASTAAT